MKKFILGVLTATLIFSLSLSAFAITSGMTIDVYPINIQVNGETFVPKDVTGREVPVFAYQGTTYAPLRALAEAYGLEVGYDAEKNMATVGETKDVPQTVSDSDMTYEDFKAMWTMDTTYGTKGRAVCYFYKGDKSLDEIKGDLKSLNNQVLTEWMKDITEEICQERGFDLLGCELYFCYGDIPPENSELDSDSVIFYADTMTRDVVILWH